MLMNHADAQRVGVIGVVDFNRLAVDPDFPFFRLIQAEKDAHQRGLSGAVFTQQRVYFALAQLEGNVVIGNDTGEALGNVQHFNCVFAAGAH